MYFEDFKGSFEWHYKIFSDFVGVQNSIFSQWSSSGVHHNQKLIRIGKRGGKLPKKKKLKKIIKSKNIIFLKLQSDIILL